VSPGGEDQHAVVTDAALAEAIGHEAVEHDDQRGAAEVEAVDGFEQKRDGAARADLSHGDELIGV